MQQKAETEQMKIILELKLDISDLQTLEARIIGVIRLPNNIYR